ncbi:hypothetical protein LJN56_09995 [Cellulomonas sp. zg-Y908]|nr:hypothetical protein [Cellulomonas wangsupingiae]
MLVVALGDDPAAAGRSLADAYLGMWENPATRPVLLALVRSATTSPAAAHMLREVIGAKLRHVAGLDGVAPDRVALAASQLLGVAVARHVIGLEPVVALSHEELVERVAPGIQRCLTGDG